jgi:hypothetical protein
MDRKWLVSGLYVTFTHSGRTVFCLVGGFVGPAWQGPGPPGTWEMNDECDAAESPPEEMEYGTQAGDDFRNEFSCGFWRLVAAPGRPSENRSFSWRLGLKQPASRFTISRQSQ